MTQFEQIGEERRRILEERYSPGVYIQWWRATNDANGNPRRLWVIWDRKGIIVDVLEDGYAGRPTQYDHCLYLGAVSITVAEYHITKRMEVANNDE